MTVSLSSGPDLLSVLLPASPHLHDLRASRDKVVQATRDSHAALFDPGLDQALDLHTRHAVALYVAVLNAQPALAEYYRSQLLDDGLAPAWRAAIEADDLDSVGDPRLQRILGYARVLTLTPEQGDRQALHGLLEQGLGPVEAVNLAQLVAFLAFEARLLGGLSVIGEKREPA
ncbi:CMD domain-containing protein [Pseudomonas huaxiensis]|uniref:CMD domain-containing protein n=1 Tax=Pseudomonas huaxiensis TaxID=2213017 RepID=UPI000DA67C73|nr:CMD domain protein [Pseudomonas huaxiensis]